jgi:hypothetical protein
MLALLEGVEMPVALKTMAASGAAAAFRIVLMPVDATKTIMQVRGCWVFVDGCGWGGVGGAARGQDSCTGEGRQRPRSFAGCWSACHTIAAPCFPAAPGAPPVRPCCALLRPAHHAPDLPAAPTPLLAQTNIQIHQWPTSPPCPPPPRPA